MRQLRAAGILLIAGAMALAACGEGGSNRSAANSAASGQSAFDRGFVREFGPSFVSSCVQSGRASGHPIGLLNRVCRCAADDLQERYSVAELMKLDPANTKPSMEKCGREAGLLPAGKSGR